MRLVLGGVPNAPPIPYKVHYFLQEPYRPRSKVVHYLGNREPFETQISDDSQAPQVSLFFVVFVRQQDLWGSVGHRATECVHQSTPVCVVVGKAKVYQAQHKQHTHTHRVSDAQGLL